MLVVDKPEGMAAIPERDLAVPSLHKALEAERHEKLFVVHRLDKEVSGLLVFARTAAMHRNLSMAFEQRRVDKTYVALLQGVVSDDAGAIVAPIHQFGSGRMGVDPRGKPSETRFEVLARGPAHTLVAAHPLTGRRHQLRVHFYHRGHPIAGDPRYGDRASQAAISRLLLHARNLVLPLPNGGSLTLESLPGPSFDVVLDRAGLASLHPGRVEVGRKD